MLKKSRSFGLALRALGVEDKVVRNDSSRANKTFKTLSKSKKLKNDKSENLTNIRVTQKLIFSIHGTKKTFNQLKQKFTKALIL